MAPSFGTSIIAVNNYNLTELLKHGNKKGRK